MTFDLSSFLLAVSTALDCAEQEIMNISSHHSKRCAYIALRIAARLDLSEEERFDLCAYALMHDNGITQAFLDQDWLEAGHEKNLKLMERFPDHCCIGEANVASFPFLTEQQNVILYHHEHYDGSGVFGKQGDEIPLMAQIIGFADELDMKFDLKKFTVTSLPELKDYVQSESGKRFAPEIVEAFLSICSSVDFWQALSNGEIQLAIERHLPEFVIFVDEERALAITEVFSRIIDSKSTFTAEHSKGLREKAKQVAQFLALPDEKNIQLQMAANLHDIGKLATPKCILEKPAELSGEEFVVMKDHVYFTHVILKDIQGLETVHQWASSHHERIDGSGYPFGLSECDLPCEAQLLAALDVYQALTEERPYRAKMTHCDAIEILSEHAEKGLFKEELVQVIDTVFTDGHEPIISKIPLCTENYLAVEAG
ncbi:MAG: HD domain-containing phosphohydrolase [Sulfurimonadaceae bacterium]|nr:HD domain-containing phosphohydrolase [Sulfurimonadaceae bacterium]